MILLVCFCSVLGEATNSGSSLSPASKNVAEHYFGMTSDTGCIPVHVMNDHAEALFSWLDSLDVRDGIHTAVEPPLKVLHIDRHSDLNVPAGCPLATPMNAPGPSRRGRSTDFDEWIAKAKSIAIEYADLANFQV